MTKILIFGDSITQGFWDEEGGWADRLKKELMKKGGDNDDNYFSVFNLGISGDTSKEVLGRFESETKQRLGELEADEKVIFIVAIGSNDSTYNNILKSNIISKEDFKLNISNIIKLSKSFNGEIIFLDCLPVDESLVSPIPWLPDYSYKNKDIKEYNSIIGEICKKEKVKLIKLHEAFSNVGHEDLLQDGAHPNSKGHELIFTLVRDYLAKEKII